MSDIVIVAIITTIGSIITAIISVSLGKAKSSDIRDKILPNKKTKKPPIQKTTKSPEENTAKPSEEGINDAIVEDINLSGEWIISEKNENNFQYYGNVTLIQNCEEFPEQMIRIEDYGQRLQFQIRLYGHIADMNIEFHASGVVLPSEYAGGYNLDHWSGKIIDQNTITGTWIDDGGIEGSFKMKKDNGLDHRFGQPQEIGGY